MLWILIIVNSWFLIPLRCLRKFRIIYKNFIFNCIAWNYILWILIFFHLSFKILFKIIIVYFRITCVLSLSFDLLFINLNLKKLTEYRLFEWAQFVLFLSLVTVYLNIKKNAEEKSFYFFWNKKWHIIKVTEVLKII